MIPFVKATAYGNDFLVVWESDFEGNRREATIALCHRTTGVGADGVEWLRKDSSGESDVVATLINSDGSGAEISGNGTRCVAAYMAEQSRARRVRIRTGTGVKECEFMSREEQSYRFAMNMGVPISVQDRKIGEWDGVFVDLGNPHFVVIVDALPKDWREVARSLQQREDAFPQGVNVEFVRVASREQVSAQFYERGAGETSSSGTGSCASAVACHHRKLVENAVKVSAPGGPQVVELGDTIKLHGEARIICRGEAWL